MILGGQGIIHALPDRHRQVEIEPRQHQRPLRQPRHRLHQRLRRAARPGGSRDDHRAGRGRHRPSCRQPLHHRTLAGLDIGGGGVGKQRRDDAKEILRPLPVGRMVGHVQRCDPVGRDPFALHLVQQVGQAFRQIMQRRARPDVGRAVQKARHQLRNLQPSAQFRHGGGQAGKHGVAAQIGDQADARHQARRRSPQGDDPAAHPFGVHDQRQACRSLGRMRGQHRAQTRHQMRRKVGTGRHRPDAGAGVGEQPIHRMPASPRPLRYPPGAPHHTSRRDGPDRKRAPVQSSHPKDG